MSAEVILAVSWPLFTKVVLRALPLQRTEETPLMKFDPFTVSVKPVPPAVANAGLIEVITGVSGTPLITISSIRTVAVLFDGLTVQRKRIELLLPYDAPKLKFAILPKLPLGFDSDVMGASVFPPVASPVRTQLVPLPEDLPLKEAVIDEKDVVDNVSSKYLPPALANEAA